ncbi:MAG: hypothetical protein J0H89_14330 [Rhizobiales bacterium]|nr:hypothetical protein [Hyphomicrobiales bacterium]
MSTDEYRVGRGRPPLDTRWKKGQSGNPRHRKRARTESVLVTIDRLLLRPIQLSLNGETRKQPALAAIVLQLLRKALSGNIRAYRVLIKYQQFASQNKETKLELTFLDSDYTRAFASLESDRDDR